MKKIVLYLSLSFVFLCVQGQTFETTYQTVEGGELSLSELAGSKLIVIDFWATWCKPCVKSIPKMIEISESLDDSEVTFVGINIDSPRNLAKVRPFANSLNINYPVLLDTEQTLYEEYMVNAVPTLIVLSSDGEILYSHEGYTPGDEDLIKEEIENLL